MLSQLSSGPASGSVMTTPEPELPPELDTEPVPPLTETVPPLPPFEPPVTPELGEPSPPAEQAASTAEGATSATTKEKERSFMSTPRKVREFTTTRASQPFRRYSVHRT